MRGVHTRTPNRCACDRTRSARRCHVVCAPGAGHPHRMRRIVRRRRWTRTHTRHRRDVFIMPDGAVSLHGAMIALDRRPAAMFHRFAAADADLPASAALNAARVPDVLSSTPALPDSRSPWPCRHLHALASRIGKILRLAALAKAVKGRSSRTGASLERAEDGESSALRPRRRSPRSRRPNGRVAHVPVGSAGRPP